LAKAHLREPTQRANRALAPNVHPPSSECDFLIRLALICRKNFTTMEIGAYFIRVLILIQAIGGN
jgi:hypothetical protein